MISVVRTIRPTAQVKPITIKAATLIFKQMASHLHRSVSYTHLDVYKRQTIIPAGNLAPGGINHSGDHAGFAFQPLLNVAVVHGLQAIGCLLYTSRCV